MIIEAGRYVQHTRIGELHLNWPLPDQTGWRCWCRPSSVAASTSVGDGSDDGRVRSDHVHDAQARRGTASRSLMTAVLPVEYEVRVAADA